MRKKTPKKKPQRTSKHWPNTLHAIALAGQLDRHFRHGCEDFRTWPAEVKAELKEALLPIVQALGLTTANLK
jgi:hypothetical protein